MTVGRIKVHLVTIREVGVGAIVAGGHVVQQIGDERVARRRAVRGVHRIVAGDPLDRRYGRVAHTTSPRCLA